MERLDDQEMQIDEPAMDYSLSANSVEFANWKLSSGKSLMASAHVDGKIKVVSFASHEELIQKHAENKADMTFHDHFYSANNATFAQNKYDLGGNALSSGVGGPQPWLLTCSDDTLIHMYDLEKQMLVRSFIGCKRFVTHAKFNSNGNLVLSACAENNLTLWDVRSNKTIIRIMAHPEPITSIDISEDSTLISSSSYDCYVRLWDVMKGQCLKTMMAAAGSKSCISFCKMSPHPNKFLLVGSMNSTIGIYNYRDELLKLYKGHRNSFHQIEGKIVNNEQTGRHMILSGSEDGHVYGWDLNTQKL